MMADRNKAVSRRVKQSHQRQFEKDLKNNKSKGDNHLH